MSGESGKVGCRQQIKFFGYALLGVIVVKLAFWVARGPIEHSAILNAVDNNQVEEFAKGVDKINESLPKMVAPGIEALTANFDAATAVFTYRASEGADLQKFQRERTEIACDIWGNALRQNEKFVLLYKFDVGNKPAAFTVRGSDCPGPS